MISFALESAAILPARSTARSDDSEPSVPTTTVLYVVISLRNVSRDSNATGHQVPRFPQKCVRSGSSGLSAAYREAVAAIDRSRTIAADPQSVWDVLADFGSISSWADNIDHSCILVFGSEPLGTP